MPEPRVTSSFIDSTGLPGNDLSLLNAMTPVSRELRAIRVLLGVILTQLGGFDIDISEFTGLEALEG